MIIDRNNEHLNQPKKFGKCEVVEKFIYLGSTLHNTGNCEPEIRKRIEIARSVMIQLARLWKDGNISKATKTALVNLGFSDLFICLRNMGH